MNFPGDGQLLELDRLSWKVSRPQLLIPPGSRIRIAVQRSGWFPGYALGTTWRHIHNDRLELCIASRSGVVGYTSSLILSTADKTFVEEVQCFALYHIAWSAGHKMNLHDQMVSHGTKLILELRHLVNIDLRYAPEQESLRTF